MIEVLMQNVERWLVIARTNAIQWVLVMFSMALLACASDDRAPVGDKVRLTFTGKSSSEYWFSLENPTSHAIYFRGIKSLWFAPIAVDTAFACKNLKTGEGTIGGPALSDSVKRGHKDPPGIEVPPGKAIKLRVKYSGINSRADLAANKGQNCQLHLILWEPNTLHQQFDSVQSQIFQF
jgi:hypothetical protein